MIEKRAQTVKLPGVPKDAFGDSDIEEVKAFLVEKCPHVKKFKKI